MDSIIDAAEQETSNETEENSLSVNAESSSGDGISEEELGELVDDLNTQITVVGCGGGGSNTLSRMIEEGIEGADLVAMNTDAQHLHEEVDAETKMLIGKKETGGRGAGGVREVGEASALEDENEIRSVLSGSDMVFITAGMGGGTGTGSAPVVAKIANDIGALTISVVTLPFSAEADDRHETARAGLAKLRDKSDTVITIPNDRVLETAGDLPLSQAFKVCDSVLMHSVKGITEMITTSGMINLDFADVESVMEEGGVAMIGFGESDTSNRANNSLRKAISSELLDVDISHADSVLVNVTGGTEMTVNEAEGIIEQLHDLVGSDTRIIWGAGEDEKLDGTIRTMIVVTGVTSDQIHGSQSQVKNTAESGTSSTNTNKQTNNSTETDIDFICE